MPLNSSFLCKYLQLKLVFIYLPIEFNLKIEFQSRGCLDQPINTACNSLQVPTTVPVWTLSLRDCDLEV